MSRRKQVAIGFGVLAVLLVGVGGALTSWMGRERPTYNLTADGVALSGWDPVSYRDDAPAPGDPGISHAHEGRRYLFANEANRARFAADPAHYEPAYGGWCAYAVANGYKFEVDPSSFVVDDGRLMLFYDGPLGDARQAFEEEGRADGVRRADANWPALRDGAT